MDRGLLCTPAVADLLGTELHRHGWKPVGPGRGGFEAAFLSNDVWHSCYDEFSAACLDTSALRWLHTSSAGIDQPLFGELADRGIRITTASGAAAPSIAASALMYLLALSRDLPRYLRCQAHRRWQPQRYRDLAGSVVGVVGMGPIGLETARLLTAHDMVPIGLRRKPRGDEPCETWRVSRLGELAERAAALVVAAPLTDDTRGLIDRAVLTALGPSGFLVNVSRGGLVDQMALTDLLRAGRLAGAALDVVAVEPLPTGDPLWSMPNVIITPHVSGISDRTTERTNTQFVDNLRRWVTGRRLVNEVTDAR